MQRSLKSRRVPLRIAGGGAGLLIAAAIAAQGALAQTAVAPKAIVTFTGLQTDGSDLGDKPGQWPRRVPVLAADGHLAGTTSQSSANSRWYSVLPGGDGYRALTLAEPITNASVSNLALAGRGAESNVYGVAVAGQQGATTIIRPFQVSPGGIPTPLEPQDENGAPIQTTFGVAVAGTAQGDVFYVSRTGDSPIIWRRNAQTGRFEKIADFGLEEYLVKRTVIGTIQVTDRWTKGQNTLALAWSEADQALYGVTEDSTVGGKSGEVATVPGDQAVGTLWRIKASAFKTDGSSEIEVLHTFAAARDGTPKTISYHQPGLLVVDDWIYGSTTAGVRSSDAKATQDGRIWRQHKDCVSTAENNCLQIVHRFDTAGELADPQGGALPIGPMVYAGDGNVYGTTHRSGTIMNAGATQALGAGTLFRIDNPTAQQLEQLAFSQVHAFDVTSTGAYPGGLALGPKADGKQTIVGVAEYGGQPTDTLNGTAAYATGFGTVFAFDVQLPAARITQFVVGEDASTLTIAENEKATLSWASEGAAVCEASGDWSGAQQASGSAEVGPLAYRAEAYQYSLTCSSADGAVSDPATVTVTVQAPPEPEPEPSPEPSPEPDSSSGGSGGALAWPGILMLAALASRRRPARPTRHAR